MAPPQDIIDQLNAVQAAAEKRSAARAARLATARALEDAAAADKTAAEAVTTADASLADALAKLIALEQTTYGSPGGAVGIIVEPGTPTSH